MRHLISLGLLLLAGPVAAAEDCTQCTGKVIHVNANSQAVGADGRSWATAYRNLKVAINKADPGDCIWVASGRYYPTSAGVRNSSFTIGKELSLYGGFAGDETCLGQRAGNFAATKLTGEIGNPAVKTDNTYTIVVIEGPVPIGQKLRVVIDGFNIRDAYNDFGLQQGGGIRSTIAAIVDVRNCIIRNNVAGVGAGLYSYGNRLDIVGCQFIGNDSMTNGGGLWIRSVRSVLDGGTGPYVFNTVFKRNTALVKGGGLYLGEQIEGHDLTFANCLFQDNAAAAGGAGFLAEDRTLAGESGRAWLTQCTVTGNTATNRGAAFVSEDSGGGSTWPSDLTLGNSVVWGNVGPGPAIDGSVFSVFPAYTVVDPGSPWDCNPIPDCTNAGVCTTFDCDPLLTPSLQLSPGSPAINSGLVTGLPLDLFDLDRDGDRAEALPIDLAGQPRILPSSAPCNPAFCVDRGAFEAP